MRERLMREKERLMRERLMREKKPVKGVAASPTPTTGRDTTTVPTPAPTKSVDICSVGIGESGGVEVVVGLTFQATDVKKALTAVWRICAKGNIVQFGGSPEDCFIRNKASNRKIFMRKKKGSYVLDVEFVTKKDGVAVSLGKGEITVDSAAEESVCPLDWGGAFPLKEPKKKMCFKTASGQDMQHYGERVVTCITQSKPAGFVRPS